MAISTSLDRDGIIRYRCDFCMDIIQDNRYFCSVCDEDTPTFDICEDCTKLEHPHPIRQAKCKLSCLCFLTTKDAEIHVKDALSCGRKIAYVPTSCYSESSRRCFQQFRERRCMGYRERLPDGTFGEYKWLIYQEVGALVKRIGAALQSLFPKACICK